MGSSNSSVKNDCINEFKNIDENSLDISNIDKLQIKALKEMNNKIDKLQKEKQTKMIYALSKIDVCNYSFF